MATNGLRRTLDRLRKALTPDRPDEQLLSAFIASRDEAAFATLVRRHGLMVLGVSRRILGNLHDSEDVFQATFLVLAQKARSVIKQGAIASWLYKVAYRISLKAKARNDRRRHTERQAAMIPAHTPPAVQDWEAALDEELSRLPEKFRLPIILFDLEGRSRREVEGQLGLAEGTLSSRLARARRRLAERLSRRGLTFSGGALAMAISEATAALPLGLVGATAQKAVLVAAGQLTAISSSVTTLMKIAAKAMFLAKLKATIATLMVVAVLGGGLAYSGSGGSQAKPQNELEALRRENELLKVNLRVTLEKIEAMEKQVKELKGQVVQKDAAVATQKLAELERLQADWLAVAHKRSADDTAKKARAEVERAAATKLADIETLLRGRTEQLESAMDALRKAQASQDNKDARRQALDALEKALKSLREAETKKK